MENSYLGGHVPSPAQTGCSIDDIREQASLSSETARCRMEEWFCFEIHGRCSGLFASPCSDKPPIQTFYRPPLQILRRNDGFLGTAAWTTRYRQQYHRGKVPQIAIFYSIDFFDPPEILYRDFFSPFGATSRNNPAPSFWFHPFQKAMGAFFSPLARLSIGDGHLSSLDQIKSLIIGRFVRGVNRKQNRRSIG